MRHAFRNALLYALALASAHAQAAVFRDVRYLEGADADRVAQSLDVYTPAWPGPHPVLLYLHAGATEDKSDALAPAAAFTARGYVFLAANYRVDARGAGPASLDDAAAAIAWAGRHVSSYGGDRERVFVLGIGEGAYAAALAASDVRRLARHGSGRDATRGIVAIASPSYELERTAEARVDLRASIVSRFGPEPSRWRAASPALLAAAGDAPRLLLFDPASEPGRRDAERYSDRLREVGVASMVLPLLGRAATRTLGAPHDHDSAQLLAWLESREVARLARFENLQFVRAAGAPPLQRLEAHAGSLFAAGRGAGAPLWRRDAADAPWHAEPLQLTAQQRFAWLGTLQQHDGERLAVIVRAGGNASLRVRDDASGSWGDALALGPAAAGAAARAIAHVDAHGTLLWLLAAGDAQAPLVRVEPGADGSLSRAVSERGVDGVLRALARANGVLHATVSTRADGSGSAGLYRRSDGADAHWSRVATFLTTDPQRKAYATELVAVPDPGGSGSEVLLAGFTDGRIARLDPGAGYATTTELEAADAFRELWNDERVSAAVAGAGFVALRQPESGDLVHLVGLRLRHPDRAAGHDSAYFLVRQLDGSYAYGIAWDFAQAAEGVGSGLARSVVASPFAAHGARALYVSAGAGDQPRLLLASLADGGVPRGLWWDRTRPGQGIDLQRVDSRWLVFVYTYDAKGDSTWYLASGEIDGAHFVADDDGLARYTLDGKRVQMRDAEGSGTIAMRFALERGDPACSADARDGAQALAHARITIGGRSQDWCLEPFRFGGDGVPRVDPSGLWSGGPADGGWGLSLHAQGYDGGTRETAIVFHHDRDGAPRWMLGSGETSRGAADITLLQFTGPCPGCEARALESRPAATLAHRFQGWCGDTRGELSLHALEHVISGEVRRSGRALQRVSEIACY